MPRRLKIGAVTVAWALYGKTRALAQRFHINALRPPMWNPHQYRPRELAVPRHYHETPLPDRAPRIALTTPSLDHGRYLRATIDSVLSQHYPHLDYFIQDGGSRDETLAVLQSYGDRLRWTSAPDRGQAHAINLGFAQVDGDIMGYLNSDDILLPGTLAHVAAAFAADPAVDILYGHRIFIDHATRETGRCVLPAHDDEVIRWADFVPQETMFWRRRVWDAVGPFDESFQYALDWDFILRARAAGFRFARVPRFLACFRVHDGQKTFAMMDVGEQEMRRLRQTHLRHDPGHLEVRQAIAGYTVRQLAVHYLHACGLLRC